MSYIKVSCPNCGRDLGSKRLDLKEEHTINTNCPSCHVRLAIIHGKGHAYVRIKK